jgi:phosphoglycolate phosphatase-like HAD superfamily hydrolase
MNVDLSRYRTLIFDCDGVILKSNQIKTEAFLQAALPWGAKLANALVEYHLSNGGISRYQKFQYFFETLLPVHAPGAIPGVDGPGLGELLDIYALGVREGLMTCEVADGLDTLRSLTACSTWSIVSGGDQGELRDIFAARALNHFFDGGIFGSPDTKDTIFAREIESGHFQTPALFLGDSHYDFVSACQAGLDFVFVSGWSEFSEWKHLVRNHRLPTVDYLGSLLSA